LTFHSDLSAFLSGKTSGLRVFKSGLASQAVVARALMARGFSSVVVVPGVRECREFDSLFRLLGPIDHDPFAPVWERGHICLGSFVPKTPGPSDWGERWAALYALEYGSRPASVVLTVDNLLPFWPAPDIVRNSWLSLSRGEDMSPELVMEQLVSWGYRRGDFVAGCGDMAMRGDILDVFAPGYPLPLRLEFFGDTLEEVRMFDLSSQRSKADLNEAVLLPVAPGICSPDRSSRALDYWKRLRTTGEMTVREEHALTDRLSNEDGYVWPGLFYDDSGGLEEHLPSNVRFILCSGGELRGRLEDCEQGWRDYLAEQERVSGLRWPMRYIVRGEAVARQVWQDCPQIVFEELTLGRERDGMELPEQRITEFADLFWQPEQVRRPWATLMQALKEWTRSGYRTILSFSSARSRDKFLSLADPENLAVQIEYHPDGKGVFALVAPFKKGVELHWCRLRILGEDVLQPNPVQAHTPSSKAFQGLDKYEDLEDGDLLVHRDYGLNCFGGLHHMKIGDVANDYLLLQFSGDDKLYLPVDRLNLVQRFKGPEAGEPALDKLGGTRWKNTTARVRKAVEKIAHELVEMYAFRRVAKGYGYGPLDELYWDFEATFGFEATPDQDKAIKEVFEDMEKPEPMDRLVCGDVGFGKTEVALRAAFRAALEGKQTALLCPTTVLAEQHYQTFTRRMESFPIRVGMLSRFVSRKHQKTVLEAAARGELDILIGTHRLLSKDVALPNIGLLILDEEQRFGVKHKERLKQFRQNIDVLTLTATPIPRTLQLSLSGLRGLSVIETPPQDRKPVETGIMTRDKKALKKVLQRELERGGQIFWVYNRVNGLERVAEFVQELVPEARVGMAHGRMTEKALEETMHGFWHAELDVLVCTAIVESGLDFPNANTLIVDQAQMFGLGQLYQLRGRVGRSDRQAYAYFVVPSVDDLQEKVRKRLRIILEMDYLGAGFKVAMEDLRLRGAGNILGEAQSGQIAKVGLELFLEMLEEEVRRLRGEQGSRASDPELNFVFEAHIPGEYIADSRERLRYYKALSAAHSDRDLKELEAEIRDRFGPVPDELATFFGILALKQVLSLLQVERAELYPGRAVLSWGEGVDAVRPEDLVAWVSAQQDRARMLPPGRIEVRYAEHESVRRALEQLAADLASLRTELPEERQ
jgi:transcription-repair coupling factor (superfamily II helicase)